MKTTDKLNVIILEMEENIKKDDALKKFEQASLMYDELIEKGWAKRSDAQIKVATEIPFNKHSLNY